MIISHKHKFIFIKTRKTAGTSLEIALSEFCGDKDIITPLRSEDENIRKALGFRGPQNWHISLRSTLQSPEKFKMLLKTQRKSIRFHNHISALKIKKQIDDYMWKNYFKFCFERNPWDQVVSRYFWRREHENQSLLDFLQSTIKPEKLNNFDLYSINNEIAVDQVYLYESLDDALEDIANRLNLEKPINLPRTKSNYRPSKSRSYHDFFGEEEMQFVQECFSREINTFGYTF